MAKLLLHIGVHRTGTTTIQRYLANAAPDLAGVHVIEAGRPDPAFAGQHRLAWGTRGEHGETIDVWPPALAELDAHPDHLHVVSAEDFWRATTPHLDALAGVLAGHDVQVLMYTRAPIPAMVSAYKTRVVHRGMTLTFSEFITDDIDRLDYTGIADRWRTRFPVEVRSFDSAIGGDGILADFCAATGIPYLPGHDPGRVNEAHPDPHVQTMRLVNRWWPSKAPTVRRHLHRGTRKGRALVAVLKPWTRRPVATDADLDRIRDQAAVYQSNR